MDVPLFQIDAFAERPFEGNPAAVMPLAEWLPDDLLQRIAQENNLSETAFFVPDLPPDATGPPGPGPTYHLRWFTPSIEVTLCGHATLATAAYLFDDVDPSAERIWFWTLSGWLSVTRGDQQGWLRMNFPAEPSSPVDLDAVVVEALGVPVHEMLQSLDLICVAPSAADVLAATPDFSALARLPQRGFVLTAAAGERYAGIDFVSRWFGGESGVDEDPVTGSAHAQIAPYWAAALGKSHLVGRQISRRGGTVDCEVIGDRVELSGAYRRYLDGVVHL
ncbi:PhzF family phenazine biosynthesis isomerase [Epidermidibacterium keratini]|uniref:PhzF family phenazine biosynthesis isomerase n=1 Tax=Epidermidibacterium keratini TaxID=1891644 RepID=A0A7L4YRZ6_9ACTN|nr:PhzF family phenazine biosynthesis protein [Epidermidibacterium keratini]QHC02021.1 PhzF family phenazine biosynthesis isomerase [Epidermidibacterium keratini]